MQHRVAFGLLFVALFPVACGAGGGDGTDYETESAGGVHVWAPNASHDLEEEKTTLHFTTAAPAAGLPIVDVDDATTYQSVQGFGASMTDSAAYLLSKLPESKRSEVLKKLFDRTHGIGLSVLRQPIGASDETPFGRYSYDDGAEDPTLSRFDIGPDEKFILPRLKDALAINPQIWFVATPWSPPGWMKTNGNMLNPCDAPAPKAPCVEHGNGFLRAKDYPSFAHYLVRFVEEYGKRGIHIDALTPQNEPMQITFFGGNPQTDGYPGMNFDEPSEAKFIAEDLAPALKAAHLDSSVQILGYDYNWEYEKSHATSYAGLLSGDATVRPLLGGIAFHCYGGDPGSMTQFHREHPELGMFVTECTSDDKRQTKSHAIESLIASMRHWARTFVTWNVAIGKNGDPHQGHGCDDCIGVIEIDGDNASLTRDYAWLGLASKFVDRGALRVHSCPSVPFKGAGDLADVEECPGEPSHGIANVAFRNPDGKRVLVLFNTNGRPVEVVVRWRGKTVKASIGAGEGKTLVW